MKKSPHKTAEIRALRPGLDSTRIGRDGLISPPARLSAEARRLWTRLASEYEISDEAGLLLLQTALEAFDRMRSAQRIIAREGVVFRDRFGAPKSHPLLVTERDARAALMAGLRALNLDVEPSRDGPGRPPGR